MEGFCYHEISDISIHAPTRGATVCSRRLQTDIVYFNPRSHERSDNNGANCGAYVNLFQSTLPREERLGAILGISTNNYKFQSTLPREERPQQPWHLQQHRYFNPRSHERSDWIHRTCSSSINAISIHAPTRGATARHGFIHRIYRISIHAPTRGATNFDFHFVYVIYISIHAPTRGAT